MDFSVEIQLIAIMVASACSILGTFLVLKSMAMVSDAITHTILLGIVIACDMCISILKSGQFKFYPSYAGLTFPFVITAIAGKQFNAVLNKAEIQSALTGILPSIVNIEIIIAIAGVVFAAIYFAKAVFFETSLEKATAN